VIDVLLALPFGIAIGLSLGMIGGGGSILAVPVLVYILGEPVREATTVSLAIVGTTALAGVLARWRSACVEWRVAIPFGLSGAVGTLAGTALNRRAGSSSILFLFALVMLAAAGAMLRRRSPPGDQATGPAPASLGRLLPAGLAVGVLTGFFGVGGGFVIVPALVLLIGLPLRRAVGTSLAAIAIISAAAFAAHIGSGAVDWTTAAGFTAAAVAGAVIGTRVADRVPTARLNELFAGLVVLVAVFLLAKNAVLVA
jgi:uncharacterized protein